MAAGALAALWLPRCHPQRVLRWAQSCIPLGLLAYALLGMHPWFRRYANTPVFNGLAYSLNIVVLGGLFVWSVLARSNSLLLRLLASAPMRALGRISYAFYLFHLLVLTRFGPYFAPRLNPIASFVTTLMLATLSWYFLEKPILSLGGGRSSASLTPQRISS